MAKSKKEDETTEPVVASEPKKESSKKNTKYTLLELVEQSEDKTDTYLGLIRTGYNEQYLSEVNRKEKGLSITPTFTIDEFKKLLK